MLLWSQIDNVQSDQLSERLPRLVWSLIDARTGSISPLRALFADIDPPATTSSRTFLAFSPRLVASPSSYGRSAFVTAVWAETSVPSDVLATRDTDLLIQELDATAIMYSADFSGLSFVSRMFVLESPPRPWEARLVS